MKRTRQVHRVLWCNQSSVSRRVARAVRRRENLNPVTCHCRSGKAVDVARQCLYVFCVLLVFVCLFVFERERFLSRSNCVL